MGGHILLADDVGRWGADLEGVLEAEGYKVAVAKSGEDALAMVCDETDLILLATTLPGRDAFSVFGELRDNPLTCRVPVIFLSGLSDVSAKLRSLDMGAEDFVIRPFKGEELLARIASILRRFPRAERRLRRRRDADARLALIKGVVEQDLPFLAPAADAGSPAGFAYPQAREMLGCEPGGEIAALESLADEGYLARAFGDRVHLCPCCRRYNLNFRTLCPYCESANVDRVETLLHFQCGHVGPIDEFRAAQAYACPKCKSAIRVHGADYERLPDHFTCGGCGRFFGQPHFSVTCLACGAASPEEEVELLDLWRYEPTNKAHLAAAEGAFEGLTLEGALEARSRPVLAAVDFQREVERELERAARYSRPFSLALLSLDGYDRFLASRETPEAVAYFREVVNSIRDATRGTDVIGEFRDDAVVVLMPETDAAGAEVVCDRLRRRVSDPAGPARAPRMTVSIGIATSGGADGTIRGLFEALAKAHRAAREQGGDRVEIAA